MGKCNSFSLAFPGDTFYIEEMAVAIVTAGKGTEVSLTPTLRKKLEFWRFLDSWDKFVDHGHKKSMFRSLSLLTLYDFVGLQS